MPSFSGEIAQAIREANRRLRVLSAAIRDAMSRAVKAAWQRTVTFSVALWGFVFQSYRAIEDFLTNVVLISRFPALGAGFIWSGTVLGYRWLVWLGIAWLAFIVTAFVFFRSKDEPHPESELVERIARWISRLVLMSASLMFAYFTTPGCGRR